MTATPGGVGPSKAASSALASDSDTRRAIIEARRLGLRPFCVTIDRKGNDYLPHLFGANGFIVIRNPLQLPRYLPRLYVQLTRNE